MPWLQVDRTGIAPLGVIALLGTETSTLDDLGATIDTSTLVLLFALMIVSAQFVVVGLLRPLRRLDPWRSAVARRCSWR